MTGQALNTRHFCSSALDASTREKCGAEGMYSDNLKLLNQMVSVYSVSHRREGVVHKFVATCGTTLQGNSLKATFEVDEERASRADDLDFEITRKCLRVLNDAIFAQPVIDGLNRYR
ncbi:MAG: hypothetical protein SGPRY_002590 [Prymnesium sp.]